MRRDIASTSAAATPHAHPSTTPYHSHIIFDDSVHPVWTLHHSAAAIVDPHHNVSARAQGSSASTCAFSLRLVLPPPSEHVRLRAAVPMRGHAAVSLQFWVRSLSDRLTAERCDTLGQFTRAGWTCAAAVCVSLRRSSEPESATRFLPLCTFGMLSTRSWRRLVVPASAFSVDIRGTFDEIIFAAGEPTASSISGAAPSAVSPVEFLLDDIVLVRSAARPSLPGPRSLWQGPRLSDPIRRSPGWCQYLSSDLPPRHSATSATAPATRSRAPALPPCRVTNGDHLAGAWIQNCHPDAIRRPDRYAYSQSLGAHSGQWDYRLCYRMGYLERERARLALSYTWRPHKCSMRVVDGMAFSRWLGGRTILFWGDSLTAQHYFSLVLMLGGAVTTIRDVAPDASSPAAAKASIERARRAASANGGRSCGRCGYSGLGDEGGAYTEASLVGGGRLIKVLGHAEMATQLSDGFRTAWWRQLWAAADVIVFNYIGHHQRTVDPAFTSYARRVSSALTAMIANTKPSAQLIMRVSNLGHPGCEADFRPLSSSAEAWRRLGGRQWRHQPGFTPAHYGAARSGPDPYDWRAPLLHEGEWAAQIRHGGGVLGAHAFARRFDVLNVSHVDRRSDGHVGAAMRLRPGAAKDGARDCLHYCFPGPSDAWASALYNLLLHEEHAR